MAKAASPALYVVHESPIVLHFLEVTLAAHGHAYAAFPTLDDFVAALPPLATGCLVLEAERLDDRKEWFFRAIRSRGGRLAILALSDGAGPAGILDASQAGSPDIRESVVAPSGIVAAVSEAMTWLQAGCMAPPASGGAH